MDLSYNIYKNIIKFILFRYGDKTEQLSETTLRDEMNRNKYLAITVKSKAIILLSKPESKFSSLNADTKKLLKDTLKKSPPELIYLTDIDVRGDKSVINLQTIKRMVADITRGLNTWVQIRPYSIFETEIPKVTFIPKHTRIENKSDIEEVLEGWHTDPKMIPHIREFDPPVTWIGGRAGDIIQIDRVTPSVGIQIIYKMVVG